MKYESLKRMINRIRAYMTHSAEGQYRLTGIKNERRIVEL
jgi:hypothetical protein